MNGEFDILDCICGSNAEVCMPCYADENVFVACNECLRTSEGFALGTEHEGEREAIYAWNEEIERVQSNTFVPDYKTIAEQLENDMRRYLYDKTPERRIQCLDKYRERLGLDTWAESQAKPK